MKKLISFEQLKDMMVYCEYDCDRIAGKDCNEKNCQIWNELEAQKCKEGVSKNDKKTG